MLGLIWCTIQSKARGNSSAFCVSELSFHFFRYKDVFWHGFRRLKRYRNLVDGIALLCLIIIVGFYMGPGSIGQFVKRDNQ